MAQIRNQIVPRDQGSKVIDPTGMKPTAFLTSGAVRNLLVNVFKSDQKAAVVTSTMISILNISPRFQNANPLELLGNVLRYEVGMGLSWAMNDYAVIDYGGKPQFQLQYQGVAKMAFASGNYADGDWYDVREGEYKGLDSRTRRPVIQWIENDEERLAKPIVGYYVWVQLIDKPPYNGKIVSLYMSHDAILRHADIYSKPFQKLGGYKGYKAAMDGKREYVKNDTPWFTPPDSTGHQKMCKKTVLLQLFKNPFLPKSNGIFDSYIEADEIQERTGVTTTYDDQFTAMAREAALAAQREAPAIEAAPAEVSVPAEETPAVEAPRAPEGNAEYGGQIARAAEAKPEPAKRGRRPKAEQAQEQNNGRDGGAADGVDMAINDRRYDKNGGGQVPFDMTDPDDPLNGGW